MADEKKNCTSFTTDWEKMYDFWRLTKEEFLETYSYISEDEYDATCDETIHYRVRNYEMPIRITEDEFVSAIVVQLENFKKSWLNKGSEAVYEHAYEIAKHEAIAEFFTENLEVNDYIHRLAPYLDGLLADFCDYESKCDKTLWTDWDELIILTEQYLIDKKLEKEENGED